MAPSSKWPQRAGNSPMLSPQSQFRAAIEAAEDPVVGREASLTPTYQFVSNINSDKPSAAASSASTLQAGTPSSSGQPSRRLTSPALTTFAPEADIAATDFAQHSDNPSRNATDGVQADNNILAPARSGANQPVYSPEHSQTACRAFQSLAPASTSTTTVDHANESPYTAQPTAQQHNAASNIRPTPINAAINKSLSQGHQDYSKYQTLSPQQQQELIAEIKSGKVNIASINALLNRHAGRTIAFTSHMARRGAGSNEASIPGQMHPNGPAGLLADHRHAAPTGAVGDSANTAGQHHATPPAHMMRDGHAKDVDVRSYPVSAQHQDQPLSSVESFPTTAQYGSGMPRAYNTNSTHHQPQTSQTIHQPVARRPGSLSSLLAPSSPYQTPPASSSPQNQNGQHPIPPLSSGKVQHHKPRAPNRTLEDTDDPYMCEVCFHMCVKGASIKAHMAARHGLDKSVKYDPRTRSELLKAGFGVPPHERFDKAIRHRTLQNTIEAAEKAANETSSWSNKSILQGNFKQLSSTPAKPTYWSPAAVTYLDGRQGTNSRLLDGHLGDPPVTAYNASSPDSSAVQSIAPPPAIRLPTPFPPAPTNTQLAAWYPRVNTRTPTPLGANLAETDATIHAARRRGGPHPSEELRNIATSALRYMDEHETDATRENVPHGEHLIPETRFEQALSRAMGHHDAIDEAWTADQERQATSGGGRNANKTLQHFESPKGSETDVAEASREAGNKRADVEDCGVVQTQKKLKTGDETDKSTAYTPN